MPRRLEGGISAAAVLFLTATCTDSKGGEIVGWHYDCGTLERDYGFFCGWVDAHRGYHVRILIFPSQNREGLLRVSVAISKRVRKS